MSLAEGVTVWTCGSVEEGETLVLYGSGTMRRRVSRKQSRRPVKHSGRSASSTREDENEEKAVKYRKRGLTSITLR